ncbi:MAG TPA: SRPBCC family protein [Gaiellaceae bacterium]
MRTTTQTIEIAARPEDVFAFVADPELLPRWAIGFAKGIRPFDGAWLVTTASGDELPLRVEADAATGVVDFYAADVPATTRVVSNDRGSEYVFTMFQPPQMPDDVFAAQIAELGRELTVLKANLESACPL